MSGEVYDSHDTGHPEREVPENSPFQLQTPHEFRDAFADLAAGATEQVGLETMQLEVCANTQPIFDALVSAKNRGVADVRLIYDRIAMIHIGVDDESGSRSEANIVRGRPVFVRGGRDKYALRNAIEERAGLIRILERLGISYLRPKPEGGSRRPLSNHNHVKLAIVDDTAWFGTMNLRALDFEISNFMMQVTDPYWVSVLKEVFDLTSQTDQTDDKIWERGETQLLLDAGVEGQSVIYDKAVEMAASLQEGDQFVLISQWAPISPMFGDFLRVLRAKAQNGSHGTILTSPKEYLHPFRWVSRLIQRSVDKNRSKYPNIDVKNLARRTHVKAFLIKRKDGSIEVLFGSHNLTEATVENGTRDVAMRTRDPLITRQIDQYLQSLMEEN